MKIKTHTFYRDHNGKWKGVARKLSLETLNRRLADTRTAYYQDIDSHAPSRGYFNKRKVGL